MAKCAGCGSPAEHYARHNESVKLCTLCAKLLPQIETRTIKNERYPRCFCCDSPIFHGGVVCVICTNSAMSWLYHNIGLDNMHNNPAVYRLVQARIRFSQYLNLKNPSAAEGWVKFFPRFGAETIDKGPDGIVMVDFEGLVYGKENIP